MNTSSKYTELSRLEAELDKRDRERAIIIWANVFGLIAAVWILFLIGASPGLVLVAIYSITIFLCGEAIHFEKLFW